VSAGALRLKSGNAVIAGVEEGIVVSRNSTRIGIASVCAAFACVMLAPSAHAQSAPLCRDPSSVPNAVYSAVVNRLDFTPSPGEDLCNQIASSEAKGCAKAVQDEAKCNNAVAAADAAAATGVCQTFVDPSEEKACLSDVKSDLAARNQQVKEAAAQGKAGCADLTNAIFNWCLGDPS